MKSRNGQVVAFVILLSVSGLASSINDPGGIIRRGSEYTGAAIIEPDLTLFFDGHTITSFNIFDVGFCLPVDGGQECNFENQSGKIINIVSQLFTSSPADFADAGGLTCLNDINSEAGCNVGAGNALFFFGLGIPSEVIPTSSVLTFSPSVNTDPDFNILYQTFTHDLGSVASSSFSIPEPASMGLMLSGLLGIGLALRRGRSDRSMIR